MKSETREIPNSFKEINDYRSIKPEGDMTVKESQNFWDKQFGCEISPNNEKCDKIQENKPDINKVSCRNQELAGKKHPVTDVQFEQKKVVTSDRIYEVVTPKFESKFEVQLPKELYLESDGKQFKECNTQLKNAVENDSELSNKFDDEQLEQIMDGDTPDGYVWHHDCEEGKMQLVDYETHQKTGHTGGRKIWGGGSENR